MEYSEEIQRTIDRYLRDELTPAELKSFREKMKADKELKEEVELQKSILEGIQAYGNQKLKNRLKQIHKENEKGKLISIAALRNEPYMLYAAASVLLIFGIYFTFQLSRSKSPQELFTAYYSTPEVNLSLRTPEASQELIKANEFYGNNNYLNAAGIYETYLTSHPEDIRIQFYCAICYIELNRTEEALTRLNFIIDNQHHVFADQATWYAALIYLDQDKTEKSILLLERIVKDINADYHNDAIELLNELK